MKTKLSFLALVFGITISFAQVETVAEKKGLWLKDPITKCTIWNSNPKGNEVISWSGSCDDNKRATGSGVLVWYEDGSIVGRYTGSMSNGKAEGSALLYFEVEDGFALYDGEFRNSEMYGYGELIFPDKSRAEGDFKHDVMNGYIKATITDGGSYDGYVKNNLPHGRGHQISADREEYFGEFNDGKREGQGTLLLLNGDIYKGQFKNDLPEGLGALSTALGEKYEGVFKVGKPNGKGTYTAVDGEIARGQFVNGEPDGKIVFSLKNGETREENWKNGKKTRL